MRPAQTPAGAVAELAIVHSPPVPRRTPRPAAEYTQHSQTVGIPAILASLRTARELAEALNC